MKKLVALLLALMMVLTSVVSFAETTTTETPSTVSCEEAGHVIPEAGFTWNPAPTCCTSGAKEYTCARCGKKITEKVGPTEQHVPAADVEAIDYIAPTCTANGIYVYAACANEGCTATNIQIVGTDAKDLALGHAWVDTVVKPTCTTAGQTNRVCSRCGATDVVDHKDALGHVWDGPKNYIEQYSTCLAEGIVGEVVTCSVCGAICTDSEFTDAKYLPKLSHTSGAVATTWQNQFFAYDAAGNCIGGNVWVKNAAGDNVRAVGTYTFDPFDNALPTHLFTIDPATSVEIVDGAEGDFEVEFYVGDMSIVTRYGAAVEYEYVPATCETDGYVSVKCACGYEKKEIVKKLGHHYDMMAVKYVDDKGETRVVDIELTWFAQMALEMYNVEVKNFLDLVDSGLSIEKILKIVYKYEYLQEHPMGDCTVAPVVEYICSTLVDTVDGAVFCHNRVNAEGWTCADHDFGTLADWAWGEAEPGDKNLVPTVLYVTQQKVDDQQAFTTKDFSTIAWCTDFTATVRCAHCAVTKDILVKGEGHELTKKVVLRPATCTSKGLEALHCAYDNCNYHVVKEIAMTAHVEDPAKTTITGLTCTEDGTRTFTCKVCAFQWTEKVPAQGHVEKLTWIKNPGCGIKGEYKIECTTCGATLETGTTSEKHIIGYTEAEAYDNIKACNNYIYNIYPAEETLKEGNTTVTKTVYRIEFTIDDCSKDALLKYTCVNCKLVVVEHKAGEHNWIFSHDAELKTEDLAAGYQIYACTEKGCEYTYNKCYYCDNCTETKEVKTTEVVEHVWDGTEIIIETEKQPTCEKEGMGWFHCGNCGGYYEDTVRAFDHSFETKYDAETGKWNYICEWCGKVETVEYAAEKYVIDTDDIVWGNKTSGTGYVTLKDELNPTFVLGERYVFIQWTWVTKNGDNVVADDCRAMTDLGGNNFSFNAKGVSVAGATLQNVVIIVTDDANAEDFGCKNLGSAVLTK